MLYRNVFRLTQRGRKCKVPVRLEVAHEQVDCSGPGLGAGKASVPRLPSSAAFRAGWPKFASPGVFAEPVERGIVGKGCRPGPVEYGDVGRSSTVLIRPPCRRRWKARQRLELQLTDTYLAGVNPVVQQNFTDAVAWPEPSRTDESFHDHFRCHAAALTRAADLVAELTRAGTLPGTRKAPLPCRRIRRDRKQRVTNKTHPCSLSSDASRHFGYTGYRSSTRYRTRRCCASR